MICTLNRRESCLRTLRSLAQQTADDFAVGVVDNGGSDGTAAAVEAMAADFPVSLKAFVEPTPGLSAARNRGAVECLESAQDEDAAFDERDLVLVFLDDDVIAVPGLIEAYRAALSNPEVAAAGGRIVPKVPEDLDPVLRPFLDAPWGGPSANFDLGNAALDLEGSGDRPAPFGGNMAIRCNRLRALGGFREDLGWGSAGGLPSEESELFQRLLRDGGRVVYAPDAEVLHCIQEEKLTREHFLAWHDRQGCASAVMLRGRRGVIGRLLSTIELRGQVKRYARRARAATSADAKFQAECKEVRAAAKLRALRGEGPSACQPCP